MNKRTEACSSKFILKLVIVFMVFPIFFIVIHLVFGFPLALILGVLIHGGTQWKGFLHKFTIVTTDIVALTGSFAICRTIWPKNKSVSQ